MLGENHSLLNEFPEYEHTIMDLMESNQKFSKEAKTYDAIDREIRKLELRDQPIDDIDMKKMKLQRAELKDSLHQQLENESN
ncbi:YdcH family protein [Gayadomonas joobiniege]|uniref:YdcH family protein n=1 Tax=Gayadomonas joobiniege TaxID=1234606 RepID=UPI0003635782|nr:YdcH family protein [Gayadomonas joobiniege]